MIEFFSKLKDNRIFQFSVVVIIILNAILIGATTYQLDPIFLNTIHLLDYAITVFFVIEILIRFIGEKEKKNFFKDGWNVFDTIIVAISLIPIPNNSSFLVLRLLRIFRVLRLISVIPELKKIIEQAFEQRDEISFNTKGEIRDSVEETLNQLDVGKIRVCEKISDEWIVNQWIKKAILLSFRLNDNEIVKASHATWYDKVPSKTANWTKDDHERAGFRYVPDAVVRKSAFIAKGVILMPSFVNLGAYVDEGTMIDTWATVGSCAQIGKNCHISGGAGIGGVLEPLQANPVIIEDNCFIGARSEVAEGVIVGEGSVLSMGVFIGASTKIIDRASGEIHMGKVPPYSVIVPGTVPGKKLPDGSEGPGLYCAVIVKRVDERTRSKTSINDLLRD